MIIALEEHFFDPGWNRVRDEALHGARPDTDFFRRMADLAHQRVTEMDEGGIDLQFISHAPPGAQGVRAGKGAEWCRASNDLLAQAVGHHPDRLGGFASVPTDDPGAGADELARAVEELGFRAAILHTLSEGPTLDDERYWPIYARAQSLGVPVYLHPADPGSVMLDNHYRGYAESHPTFVRAAWGFMVEAGTQAMRLVLSGVFDRCPDLQIVLGHLGETIPYQMERIDEALSRDTPVKNFRQVFTRHFHVTTSGFFSDKALRCAIDEMGADRVLFSVDWPFARNDAGTAWLKSAPISEDEREAIAGGNARRLLNI